MALYTQSPQFQTWLDELAAMTSTYKSENLYAADSHGIIRMANLKEYFNRIARLSPKLILIGEAPGYQGTRRTGVPFASEHIIDGGMPEVDFFSDHTGFSRVYDERTYKEPTSTIMWRTISKYPELPLLWAVYPLHPHQEGNLQSNRTPTRSEVEGAKSHLIKLLEITGITSVLSLGNTAKVTLDDLGIPSIKLRHPARGGGPTFARQLNEFILTN
jgi:uracil-DNA glycosylase